jgi:EAL domain-containing protein (putative c-di-GMP-specific phosphodiesterase class I)
MPAGSPAVSGISGAATRLAETAREISGCDGVVVFWIDAAGNVLVPLGAAGFDLEGQPVIHPGQGAVGGGFETGVPVWIESDYGGTGYARPFMRGLGTDSLFAVPVNMDGATVAVIAGECRHAVAFDDTMRAALERLATEAVPKLGALGGLLAESIVIRAEYSLVASLIRDFAADDDFESTCARISRVAMMLLGCDFTTVSRRTNEGGYTFHGLTGVTLDAWATGIAGRTSEVELRIDRGETVVVDFEANPEFAPSFRLSRAEGARIVMLAPIMLGQRRIGNLLAGWRTRVVPSPRLRHLGETLAGHSAIALSEAGRVREALLESEPHARELRRAILAHELDLVYQPIFDARTGNVTMVEALCRWPGGPESVRAPARFIPLAEECGLIGSLTDFVVERAARDWSALQRPDITVAVNVSMRSFADRSFAAGILERLAAADVAPHSFGIELTESSHLHDRGGAAELVARLSAEGVRVSIDDFGEGYAALSYLKIFRASHLKIDRRFITNIAEDRDDRTIVRALVELAHALGVQVIAEGIESAAAIDIVKRLGCDLLQGYACARPMEFERLVALLG